MSVRTVWRNIPAQLEHDWKRSELLRRLPDTASCADGQVLSLFQYLSESPQKYYSRQAQQIYLAFLSDLTSGRPAELKAYLDDHLPRISSAHFFLGEINAEPWHETSEGFDDYDTLRFLDRRVHPAYLRLVEGVLYSLIHNAAWFQRTSRSAGTDGLDIFNAVQELIGTTFEPLVKPYRNVVRNGIAHGGVAFGRNEVEYTDKKGNSETLATTEVIRLFDDLVDICNGVALASRIFFLSRPASSREPPRAVLLDELRAETESPWWRVEGAVPSTVPQGSQLILYARPNTRDALKVQYYSFLTAVLCEHLAPGYDRYFLSLRSQVALPGFAAFDGRALAAIRVAGPTSENDYQGVLEKGGLLFAPRVRLPRLLGKVDSLFRIFLSVGRAALRSARLTAGRPVLEVRRAQLHRNGLRTVLNGTVLFETQTGSPEPKEILENLHGILRQSTRSARRKARCLRWLPLGWARIAVVQRDYRARRLLSFGLHEDLVCTVQISRISRINAPDILDSTVEQHGKYRVAWNRGWLEKTANKSTERADESASQD
jgi:hypothetical protein